MLVVGRSGGGTLGNGRPQICDSRSQKALLKLEREGYTPMQDHKMQQHQHQHEVKLQPLGPGLENRLPPVVAQRLHQRIQRSQDEGRRRRGVTTHAAPAKKVAPEDVIFEIKHPLRRTASEPFMQSWEYNSVNLTKGSGRRYTSGSCHDAPVQSEEEEDPSTVEADYESEVDGTDGEEESEEEASVDVESARWAADYFSNVYGGLHCAAREVGYSESGSGPRRITAGSLEGLIAHFVNIERSVDGTYRFLSHI